MKTKITKESRNLLIALLLGDGTIMNNNVFKLAHCEQQKDYLEWKIKQLKEAGIRNSGLKTYISSNGYNVGKTLLNRLDAKGIAIWYMDDGHINIRKDKNGRPMGFYVKIATCLPKRELQIILDYFKEVWDVKFYMFHEGKKEDSYSLCCGTKEGIKFINIVKPYVSQVPSMIHKIIYDLSQRRRPLDVHQMVEIGDTRKE